MTLAVDGGTRRTYAGITCFRWLVLLIVLVRSAHTGIASSLGIPDDPKRFPRILRDLRDSKEDSKGFPRRG